MANKELNRLIRTVKVSCPGAVDTGIQYVMMSAADELLRGSRVWKEEIPFSVTPTSTFYELDSEESSALILSLIKVVDANEHLIKAYMKQPGEVTLPTAPNAAATYTAHVVLTLEDPTDNEDNPKIPLFVLEKYREVLLDGVLGKLMSQPAKPYSNDRMAVYHLRRFRNGIAQAKTDAHRLHVEAGQKWRFPGGWR